MSQKTYVIRSYSFGYNDETFYVAGSRVHSSYQDEAKARQAYATLERNSINQFRLDERESFFGASKNFIAQADAFNFCQNR